MRPQRKAGENSTRRYRQNHLIKCFNEAPAQSWGKRKTGDWDLAQNDASMRPQRKAGENLPGDILPIRDAPLQ